jgi:hypothetical protein
MYLRMRVINSPLRLFGICCCVLLLLLRFVRVLLLEQPRGMRTRGGRLLSRGRGGGGGGVVVDLEKGVECMDDG